MSKKYKPIHGSMVTEIYSETMPWIRYNFEYDPFSMELQKQDIDKSVVIGCQPHEINSFGYRSDEFKRDHDGMHILFNGCSQTFGTGLIKDEMWTTKIMNNISYKNKVSGNFNISYLARGPHNIINETIKYCKLYGNPNIIFILFPDQYRFFGPLNNSDKIHQYVFLDKNAIKDKDHHIDEVNRSFWHNVFINTFGWQYRMLEIYCKDNNIKLVSSSWNNWLYDALKEFNFSTFHNMFEGDDFGKELFDYKENNKDKKFLDVARDNCHFGSAWHHAFYKKMWEFYNV